MNKFWTILSHTYLTKIKAKSFIISTVIAIIFVVGLANLQSIIDLFSGDGKDEVAIIDESGGLIDGFVENAEQANDEIDMVVYEGTEEEAKTAVQEDEFKALIVLSLDDTGLPEGTYYANTISETGMQSFFEQQLQQLKIIMASQQSGMDPATLMEINSPVSFEVVPLDEAAKTSEELNQARGIVYIMLFVLYIAVMSYGQMIMTDVANEKSSRVMEILVSSAPAITHMFAKIIGIALVGLTQVGALVLVGYFLIQSKQDELMGGIFEYLGFQDVSISIYIYAIVFFLLGYLLYATLAATLGSLVSRVEDAGQMMIPMIFLIMIAFFIAMFGLNAPDTTLVTVTSYIPFFSPMIMFMRVGMLDVPVWEVAISIGILIATIILLAAIGARIYKGGVLMYGRSSSFKDIKKALALSKKE
ncbi:ABC transporter permease [Oceanobacillus piezotolerans]|uniref:ABC transporter permease n=1 Tax=Oceanobacillus piezotolerans TaxID=2448030 RepID=A0A498DAE3_9BACI|nr:ABC transporter permease [Oceanobacillus piezotolerans]RLL45000.1 ABC transporter permease [Oceanobacillus piezotolerans]